ncbi:anoctamin-5-like isoform X2 [Limulus polyphemus]|uniref:Anoctamin n=1 Tax=Limulus polyphemus TaxID=6850 RepID=A0ABM1SXX9_LIMPO|nr:anoctamin-5-like isoform X2 [Limulus polyphemus]
MNEDKPLIYLDVDLEEKRFSVEFVIHSQTLQLETKSVGEEKLYDHQDVDVPEERFSAEVAIPSERLQAKDEEKTFDHLYLCIPEKRFSAELVIHNQILQLEIKSLNGETFHEHIDISPPKKKVSAEIVVHNQMLQSEMSLSGEKFHEHIDVSTPEKKVSAVSTVSDISCYKSAEDFWHEDNKEFCEKDRKDEFSETRSMKTTLGSGEEQNGTSRKASYDTDLPSRHYNASLTEPSMFFEDGFRRIDFVLLYVTPAKSNYGYVHKQIREVFEENLKDEGLELEYVTESVTDLNCVKVHAPWEVLTQYAELLKFKMLIKKFSNEEIIARAVHDSSDFEQMSDCQNSESSFRKYLLDIILLCQSISTFFSFKMPQDIHITAEYSRDKECLFEIPQRKKEDFFNPGLRSQIVDFILRRNRFRNELDQVCAFGITKLINDGVYEAAYPLHEGIYSTLDENSPRRQLINKWANMGSMWKNQPLDDIKEYFGVKIGLYFAWLGFYTCMLVPASIVGILCFLYSCFTLTNKPLSNDVCEDLKDILMCPQCGMHLCRFWRLGEMCMYSKMANFFDSGPVVFMAGFMSLWGVIFLELWKRYSANITHQWDMTGFDTIQEYPRPEYLARLPVVKRKKLNVVTNVYEPYIPFWKKRVPLFLFSFSMVLLSVTIALGAIIGVIMYRLSIKAAIIISNDEKVASAASVIISTTAAILNLFRILLFNQMYQRIAIYLTELEMYRTQTEYNNSLTFKMFLLQFVNYYSSIFYIAFFKGRFLKNPGPNNEFFGFQKEDCGIRGCFIELSLQLIIIMVGKQAVNAFVEMGIPWLFWVHKRWKMRKKEKYMKRKQAVVQWENDYSLAAWRPNGLFYEYLEMVLQFGFVTIFIAAFPLAPLFALVNNMLEIRLDAKKFITCYRRSVGQRVKNIGIWYRILDSISKLAVITNALIIAFTSTFIDQLFYMFVVSPDGSLRGYLNFTLSKFNIADLADTYKIIDFNLTTSICWYQGYKEPPSSSNKYEYRPVHWHILAFRLAFIVAFEVKLIPSKSIRTL